MAASLQVSTSWLPSMTAIPVNQMLSLLAAEDHSKQRTRTLPMHPKLLSARAAKTREALSLFDRSPSGSLKYSHA